MEKHRRMEPRMRHGELMERRGGRHDEKRLNCNGQVVHGESNELEHGEEEQPSELHDEEEQPSELHGEEEQLSELHGEEEHGEVVQHGGLGHGWLQLRRWDHELPMEHGLELRQWHH